MDSSPSSSSVHGIPQARILKWVAISFSRGSSPPRVELAFPVSPALAGGFFITQPPGKPYMSQFWHLNPISVVCIQCFWCVSKSSQPLTSDPTSLAPGFLLLLLCVELLTPYTLFHFSASVLSSTSKLEEGNQVTSSLSSSNPLCKSGRRPNACSMLVLFEFTSEMLSFPSPGWGPAGLGGPHTGVSQVMCRL